MITHGAKAFLCDKNVLFYAEKCAWRKEWNCDMKHYTREDIVRLVREEDVEFIRLQYTDMFGTLDNRCCFDSSPIETLGWREETDLYLHPDYDTFEIFPWRPQRGKVARLICDMYHVDGTAFEADSRYILKRAIARAKEMGYQFGTLGELKR